MQQTQLTPSTINNNNNNNNNNDNNNNHHHNNNNSEDEEVRTLYLTGFPPDVKHREVHNLFRFFTGYEDSIVKPNGVVFALFTAKKHAMMALSTLNGIQFDPDSPEMLRVELAKANTKRKRELDEGSAEFFSKERIEMRLQRHTQMSYSAQYAPLGNNDGSVAPSNMYGIPYGGNPLPAYNPYNMDPFAASFASSIPSYSPGAAHDQRRKPIKKGNGVVAQPCCTLFISNMNLDVEQEDLYSLFSRLDGFVRMQMYKKRDVMNAFAQFSDLTSSANALAALQGVSLASSTRGPLHIEYARNEMVLRSDFQGEGQQHPSPAKYRQ